MNLSDPASAPDEPHYVEAKLNAGGRVVITFKRFKYKHCKTSRWFWTAERAEVI
jgi:hypothetical protein